MDVDARSGGLQGQAANPDPQTDTRFWKKNISASLTCDRFKSFTSSNVAKFNQDHVHLFLFDLFWVQPPWRRSLLYSDRGLWRRQLPHSPTASVFLRRSRGRWACGSDLGWGCAGESASSVPPIPFLVAVKNIECGLNWNCVKKKKFP